MHGSEVHESREGPSTLETLILAKCNSALDATFSSGGKDVIYLEEILCRISFNLDAEHLLQRNKIDIEALLKQEKFIINHSLDHDLLASRLVVNPPTVTSPMPVFQQQLPSVEDRGSDDEDEPDAD